MLRQIHFILCYYQAISKCKVGNDERSHFGNKDKATKSGLQSCIRDDGNV